MDKVWRKYLLGCLLSTLLMLPIGYLIWQSLRLLGYQEPREAPVVLQYGALVIILFVMIIVFHFATGDTYNELQRRRLEKKKHRK
jgi:hypothetical protein